MGEVSGISGLDNILAHIMLVRFQWSFKTGVAISLQTRTEKH
jgi:hypothetical protein